MELMMTNPICRVACAESRFPRATPSSTVLPIVRATYAGKTGCSWIARRMAPPMTSATPMRSVSACEVVVLDILAPELIDADPALPSNGRSGSEVLREGVACGLIEIRRGQVYGGRAVRGWGGT